KNIYCHVFNKKSSGTSITALKSLSFNAACFSVGSIILSSTVSSTSARTSSRKIVTKSKASAPRSEEHTSELQSRFDLVCRLLLEPPPPDSYTLSLHDALPI